MQNRLSELKRLPRGARRAARGWWRARGRPRTAARRSDRPAQKPDDRGARRGPREAPQVIVTGVATADSLVTDDNDVYWRASALDSAGDAFDVVVAKCPIGGGCPRGAEPSWGTASAGARLRGRPRGRPRRREGRRPRRRPAPGLRDRRVRREALHRDVDLRRHHFRLGRGQRVSASSALRDTPRAPAPWTRARSATARRRTSSG